MNLNITFNLKYTKPFYLKDALKNGVLLIGGVENTLNGVF